MIKGFENQSRSHISSTTDRYDGKKKKYSSVSRTRSNTHLSKSDCTFPMIRLSCLYHSTYNRWERHTEALDEIASTEDKPLNTQSHFTQVKTCIDFFVPKYDPNLLCRTDYCQERPREREQNNDRWRQRNLKRTISESSMFETKNQIQTSFDTNTEVYSFRDWSFVSFLSTDSTLRCIIKFNNTNDKIRKF